MHGISHYPVDAEFIAVIRQQDYESVKMCTFFSRLCLSCGHTLSSGNQQSVLANGNPSNGLHFTCSTAQLLFLFVSLE